MIKFKNIDSKYIADIILPDSEMLPARLDTGAQITTVAYSDILNLTHIEDTSLKQFIKKYGSHRVKGVGGQWEPAVLCFLRDTQLGDFILPEFYFTLSIPVNRTLIGYDLINFCSIKKNACSDIIVTDFDIDSYTKSVCTQFKNNPPLELLSLEKKFDPVIWYKQLPAEHKDKLHQYSVPLYTVLSVGQYLDEFDTILAGFRDQYGV